MNIDKKAEKEREKEKEEIKEEHLEKLKHTKNKTIFTAFGHAIDGIIKAFNTERNLRIDYIIGLFVLISSLFFDFSKTEFACLCLTIGFVIFSEMINSTVEYIVDLTTDKYDERAKAAKDIAAGGVFVSSVVAVVVAYFLFVDKIYQASTNLITTILNSRLYTLFIIVFAVLVLAIILKGIFAKSGKYDYSNPSARVVLAFAMSTYVYLVTQSIFVGGVAMALSMLIAQIKVENTKNKPIYMIFSALIGILIVLIIYQIVLFKPDIASFVHNLIGK